MSAVKCRAALEIALNGMTPALATAWENTPYTPANGTPYQIVHLMLAEPDNPEMSSKLYTEMGIMQVTLMYPLQTGANAAEARAELIRQQFKRGLALVNGGIMVVINRTPEISPGYNDGERYCKPVKIRFYAHTFS